MERAQREKGETAGEVLGGEAEGFTSNEAGGRGAESRAKEVCSSTAADMTWVGCRRARAEARNVPD